MKEWCKNGGMFSYTVCQQTVRDVLSIRELRRMKWNGLLYLLLGLVLFVLYY